MKARGKRKNAVEGGKIVGCRKGTWKKSRGEDRKLGLRRQGEWGCYANIEREGAKWAPQTERVFVQ